MRCCLMYKDAHTLSDRLLILYLGCHETHSRHQVPVKSAGRPIDQSKRIPNYFYFRAKRETPELV